jgi:WD40 repeat protein
MEDLGSDFFVRSLHEHLRAMDQKVAELTFDNEGLQKEIVSLKNVVDLKDRMLREYLRRVALLEFALKKERGYGVVGTKQEQPILAPQVVFDEAKPCRNVKDMIRKYLSEIGTDLVIPSNAELAKVVDSELGSMRQEHVTPTERENVSPISFSKSTTILASLFPLRTLSFAGDCLLSGGDDCLGKLWENPSHIRGEIPDLKNIFSSQNSVTPSVVLRGHGGVPIVASCGNATRVVTGDANGTIVTWSVSDLGKINEIYPSSEDLEKITLPVTYSSAHAGTITSIDINDPQWVVSAGVDSVVRVWGRNTHEEFKFNSVPNSVVWHPVRQDLILAGLDDGELTLVDVSTEAVVNTVPLGGGILKLARGVHGTIVVSQNEGTIWTVDLRANGERTKISSNDHMVCMDASGNTIVSGGVDGAVRIFDIRRPDTVVQSWRHESITCVSIRNNSIATGGEDGKIFLFSH